jgi:hypothetical protein
VVEAAGKLSSQAAIIDGEIVVRMMRTVSPTSTPCASWRDGQRCGG